MDNFRQVGMIQKDLNLEAEISTQGWELLKGREGKEGYGRGDGRREGLVDRTQHSATREYRCRPQVGQRLASGKSRKMLAVTKPREYASMYTKIRQNAESYPDSHQTSLSRCDKRFRAGLHLDDNGVARRGG